ncbi:MAG TPA: flavodoxin-dependent (E)-4-hydroxy-3-methylbut-2-enyl-diphosphate synthase [Spirochaetota bacterium]|nr:flavodoxin-dependent (E)-4-hydroxy-3-methylbut-2-enyl-diphosphate synthase [Spirochaetota bacterium]HOM37817.1 flavodoxin-dependent (E)-4-hydroxy-3-methylbut-2-enyl-diphosphate synthase [Spirochaetota bacterium]HPQ49306.1 flavodoxin-dependent (E)-4-hydroxy-3-methylbut-2-enyl-diphosphate synthase [Spirochaetota bacterium]
MKRSKTRVISVGNVRIGGENPIVIQSMTNTETKDKEKTLTQIISLKNEGAKIVRVSVKDNRDVEVLPYLIEKSGIPLIADIHFDYKLAIESIRKGIAGIRINPGNIKDEKKLIEIIKEAKIKNTAIRIGVNTGSIDRTRYKPDSEGMVYSALDFIKEAEKLGFYNIKVSLKSSDIKNNIEANRLFSQKSNYPLHIGVTEAGPLMISAVRSSIGIGVLLLDGIGDTIRVSVTGDPVNEVKIAKEILISLGLMNGIKWISCPTCGRTSIDVEKITLELMDSFKNFDDINKIITIAVMGCTVNGPGEAKDSDIAVVGGTDYSLIYIKGSIYKKVENFNIFKELKQVIESYFLS